MSKISKRTAPVIFFLLSIAISCTVDNPQYNIEKGIYRAKLLNSYEQRGDQIYYSILDDHRIIWHMSDYTGGEDIMGEYFLTEKNKYKVKWESGYENGLEEYFTLSREDNFLTIKTNFGSLTKEHRNEDIIVQSKINDNDNFSIAENQPASNTKNSDSTIGLNVPSFNWKWFDMTIIGCSILLPDFFFTSTAENNNDFHFITEFDQSFGMEIKKYIGDKAGLKAELEDHLKTGTIEQNYSDTSYELTIESGGEVYYYKTILKNGYIYNVAIFHPKKYYNNFNANAQKIMSSLNFNTQSLTLPEFQLPRPASIQNNFNVKESIINNKWWLVNESYQKNGVGGNWQKNEKDNYLLFDKNNRTFEWVLEGLKETGKYVFLEKEGILMLDFENDITKGNNEKRSFRFTLEKNILQLSEVDIGAGQDYTFNIY